LLALAILFLMLAGGYLLIVTPVLDLYAQREAMLDDRQVLAPRLNAAVEQLPALRARLAEVKATASTHNITLDGASDTIASANLQSRIEELATSAGVTIGSTQGVTTENRGSYRWIGLHFVISGEYEPIIKLLSVIESTTPPLVLSNLQLHSALRARAEGMSARLDAGFEVYGLRGTGSSVVLSQ
jgi:general secretion pathway protein M